MTLVEKANQFKALGHPARLQILNLLECNSSRCVCELVGVLGVGQSFVSRHLAILREADLVQVEKKGVWAYYRLTEQAESLMTVANMKDIATLKSAKAKLEKSACQPC